MQNRNRIEKLTTRRTRFRFLWLMCIPLLLSGTVLSSHGEKTIDLLLIPAEVSTKASEQLLLDIVNNSGHLVAVGELGRIIYSDNECKGWKQAQVPVSVTLLSVVFTSPKKGWAIGHDGVVLHTRDGGNTWEKNLDGYEVDDMMMVHIQQMIEATSRDLERAEKSQDAAQLEALQLKHENLDFLLNDFEYRKREGPQNPLMDIWFKNDKEGIVIGAFGTILRTTDEGENWVSLLDGIDNTDGWHFYGITQSGNDLFVAGEQGILFRSDDWGKNWKTLTSPYDGSFFGIIGSPDGRFVIAFGLRGHTFYSHDRGESWATSEINTEFSISEGILLADGSVCLICADGTLMRSTDEGRTFKKLPEKFPDDSISLTERSAGNLVGVGLTGVHLMDNAY